MQVYRLFRSALCTAVKYCVIKWNNSMLNETKILTDSCKLISWKNQTPWLSTEQSTFYFQPIFSQCLHHGRIVNNSLNVYISIEWLWRLINERTTIYNNFLLCYIEMSIHIKVQASSKYPKHPSPYCTNFYFHFTEREITALSHKCTWKVRCGKELGGSRLR